MEIQRFEAAFSSQQRSHSTFKPSLPDLHDTDRLAQWVALVAELMMVAVCVWYIVLGELFAATISAVPILMIFAGQLASLTGRSWPIAPHFILLVVAAAQLTLGYSISPQIILWAFPTLVGAFLIARTSYVNFYAFIMLLGGSAITYHAGDFDFAMRFAPAFAGMWMFLYILVQVMYGLRYNAWRQSITDPLTGCYNRRYLDQVMQENTGSGRAAIILLDMDKFKLLNDEKGHDAGDKALCRLARLVDANWASEAICFRLGGDEFILLLQLPERGKEQMSIREQDRHLTQMAKNITDILNRDGGFTVFGGLAHFGWPCDFDDVYRRADAALYSAKALGRERLCVGQPEWKGSQHVVPPTDFRVTPSAPPTVNG